ncbi:MAG TPA: hypothetical protein VF519_04585 [Mycobacteriales bacterium]
MSRRALLALSAVLATALPGSGEAATPPAWVRTSAADGAVVLAVEGNGTVGLAGGAVHYVDELTRVTAAGTTERLAWEFRIVCLARGAGIKVESGCVVLADRTPVTTGTLLPESGTIRARVPVTGRRGGWIEADLALTGTGVPLTLPPSPGVYPSFRDVAGTSVPAGAYTGTGAYRIREASLSGTVRTDRTRATPVRRWETPFRTMVFFDDRVESRVHADPGAVAEELRRALVDALA